MSGYTGRLEAVADAARLFADNQTCLDADCSHKVCVLNKALARLNGRRVPVSWDDRPLPPPRQREGQA